MDHLNWERARGMFQKRRLKHFLLLCELSVVAQKSPEKRERRQWLSRRHGPPWGGGGGRRSRQIHIDVKELVWGVGGGE